MPIGYHWDGNDLILNLLVQPRASRSEWVGEHGGSTLKLRIAATPVDGKANAQLVAFLANEFGVKRNDVILLNGANARHKRFRIVAPVIFPEVIQPAGNP